MAEINSFTGLRTIEVASGEDMHPANNLGELRSPATALQNLGLTATKSELNLLDNAPATVTFSAAAGAANVMAVTLAVKDAAGATIAAHQRLEVYITESAAGLGLTADTISGDATWRANEELDEVTSKKRFRILTAADGTAVLSIEDSGKPTDQRLAVVHPITGKLIVSDALNAWGA